jgi:hypothetical protein
MSLKPDRDDVTAAVGLLAAAAALALIDPRLLVAAAGIILMVVGTLRGNRR